MPTLEDVLRDTPFSQMEETECPQVDEIKPDTNFLDSDDSSVVIF